MLQPLDVSVLCSIKSYKERNIPAACRHSPVLDAFRIARILRCSYEQSHTSANIRSGFSTSGILDETRCKASIERLRGLLFHMNHLSYVDVCGVRSIPTL